ncbi:MAG: hypothetical protein V1934_04950 [Methanobacteriota archaeon]
MDSEAFISALEEKLATVSPMAKPVIERQLEQMGLTREMLSPHQAEMLTRRVAEALKMFLGPSGAEIARNMMMKELRKRAPDYFSAQGL